VERQLPRRRAPLLCAVTPGVVARLADAAAGQPRPVRRAPARAGAERQLRHQPRRLHAARPRVPTTTRATRPTARASRDGSRDNHSCNCGAEGETARRGSASRCARARCATCWPSRCCRWARPC
jgi:hypothetical protein